MNVAAAHQKKHSNRAHLSKAASSGWAAGDTTHAEQQNNNSREVRRMLDLRLLPGRESAAPDIAAVAPELCQEKVVPFPQALINEAGDVKQRRKKDGWVGTVGSKAAGPGEAR